MSNAGIALPARRVDASQNQWRRFRDFIFIRLNRRGTTNARPAAAFYGTYFDTTLGQPIWRRDDGVWVDSTGTAA